MLVQVCMISYPADTCTSLNWVPVGQRSWRGQASLDVQWMRLACMAFFHPSRISHIRPYGCAIIILKFIKLTVCQFTFAFEAWIVTVQFTESSSIFLLHMSNAFPLLNFNPRIFIDSLYSTVTFTVPICIKFSGPSCSISGADLLKFALYLVGSVFLVWYSREVLSKCSWCSHCLIHSTVVIYTGVTLG